MPQPLPSGFTEQEVLSVIDQVTGPLVSRFRKFAYFDADDLKQEIFGFCWRALPFYDPSKGTLGGYLFRTASNRLCNLKRNSTVRADTPCVHCKQSDDTCGRPPERSDHPEGFCQRYLDWRGRNEKKFALASPFDVSLTDVHRMTADDATTGDMEIDEILRLIRDRLPVADYGNWLRLRDGVHVPADARRKVVAQIKEILAELDLEIDLSAIVP